MISELPSTKTTDNSDPHAVSDNTTLPQSSPNVDPRREHKKMENLGSLKDSNSGDEIWLKTPDTDLPDVDLNHDRRKRRRTASPRVEELPKCVRERTPPKQSSPRDFQRINVGTPGQQKGMTNFFTDSEPGGKPLVINDKQCSPLGLSMDAERHQALRGSIVPSRAASGDLRHITNGGNTDTSQKPPNHTSIISDESGSKPKRTLRLNSQTGTIGSPPAKKGGKAGRASRSKQPASKLVVVHYGESTNLSPEIGQKIDQILQGTETAASLVRKQPTANQKPISRKIAGANPGAAPHPFFLGKLPAKAPVVQESLASTSEEKGAAYAKESNILNLIGPNFPRKPPSKTPAPGFPGFGGFGTNTAKILKFPGAVEPAWPWRGMTHVRGSGEPLNDNQGPNNCLSKLPSRVKKSKYQAVEVLADEDVIDALAKELCVSSILKTIRDINIDEYPPLPECLRPPTRHFLTGIQLQTRVQQELSTPLPPVSANDDESEDDIQGPGLKKAQVHPALSNIFNSMATSLSAFDQSRCETQSWTQKYLPKVAAEVLQTGREALILKEWLQTLTVSSVTTVAGDRPHSRAPSASRPSAVTGKRKYKSKKLEGFVVSSDEEDGDLDEISEPEDDASPLGSQGTKRTVVRGGKTSTKGSGRLANAVVLSGPHGCGKSAAVYAAAKELGFEIFEINSSSRRSGRDILEKVGDMTHNHLVQNAQHHTPVEPVDEDAKRIEDALEGDIKSGRQGTMNSFFKPKTSTKVKSKPKKSEAASPSTDFGSGKIKNAPKAPPKQQKQSLILFEEVDILYDEDKQFWATVIAMIAQSKRPVIITCTDEAAVPVDSLPLHAIIRFAPPPVDLATDYMLLVAATEGHLLRRDAVKSLYESRRLDLRASLAELNFWCQFAVGDMKGGLEWLYPRWPPGKDVDEHGHTIRVVSEGTYETGMGWLSHDFLESHVPCLEIEEETLHETWAGWHLDIGDAEKSLDMAAWASKVQSQSKGKRHNIALLGMYDDFLDAMSAADICAGGVFAPDNKVRSYGVAGYTKFRSNCSQAQLDASLPELSSKAREDYIIAYNLLEAAPLVNFESTGADISIWMKSRARKYLQIDEHIKHGFEVPVELDRPSESRIIELIRDQSCSPDTSLTRKDFSLAFDPISEPEKGSLYGTGSLEASSFDRNFSLIPLDIAPYVRSIVAYDARLQQDRSRLSNLMSEGGRKGKRMRTTRSAMSALEGGARSTTRRDRYFGSGLNTYSVLRTGMQCWLDAMLAETKIAEAKITKTKTDKEDSTCSEFENGAREVVEENLASDGLDRLGK